MSKLPVFCRKNFPRGGLELHVQPQGGHDHRTAIAVVTGIVDVLRTQGLTAELMEDQIRNHMPLNSKSSEEAADDVIQIVRTYLK